MRLEFRFENPHTDWAVLHVFKKYYEQFINENPNIICSYVNSSKFYDGNPSGIYSAQLMTITNLDTKKYLIISYWDRPIEMTWDGNGWDTKNRVELISSSGAKPEMNFTPYSYLPYSIVFEDLSLKSKKMDEKEKNELEFRGFLYNERLSLSKIGDINISDKKIFPFETYFDDLTNNKICLSLNGAGEICNRDIEILSARSALLRPELKLQFHNKLIPNYHYISFEMDNDPIILNKIILDRYYEVKDDVEFLKYISENGYQWYLENGTIDSDVKILKEIIDINKLQ
jgi:hypothetical protein